MMDGLSPGQVALCSIVRAELLYGALKSARSNRNMEQLARFLRGFPCLPFNEAASEAYANIRVQLEKAGKPVGPNDLLIAAIAIANQLVLVTRNTREFSQIEGLVLEDWETPAV